MNRTAITAELAAIAKDVSAMGEETIAERDRKQTRLIRHVLIDALAEVGGAVDTIDMNLSDFNAPGLRAEFIKALKAGITFNGYDPARAIAVLTKYIDRS